MRFLMVLTQEILLIKKIIALVLRMDNQEMKIKFYQRKKFKPDQRVQYIEKR